MSQERYLNQTQAADVYNCSRVAIRNAMAKGRALYPATVLRNGRRTVDMDHIAAREYRTAHRVDNPREPVRTIDTPQPRDMTPEDIEPEIRAYWDWTLGDIIKKCGTMARFESLLKAVDKVETIYARRLDSDKKTGELISREYVHKNVMGLIERVFQRLLSEVPVSLALEVHGRCEKGATLEEIQESIHDRISSELSTVKRDSKKAIRNATD